MFLKTLLETASKRRREPEGESPSVGFGASPKRGMGWQPHRNPVLKREAHKDKNQEAERNLIPPRQLETAAKRRRESEGEASSVGVGASPKQVIGRQPYLVTPFSSAKRIKTRIRKQSET